MKNSEGHRRTLKDKKEKQDKRIRVKKGFDKTKKRSIIIGKKIKKRKKQKQNSKDKTTKHTNN